MQNPKYITSLSIRTWRAALLCGLLLASTLSQAMSIRELRALENSDAEQGDNYKAYYLVGVVEGVLQAHDQSVRDGGKPTICLNGRRLEPSMMEGLYQTELKRNEDLYEADMPVPLVISNALGTAYAC